MSNYGHIPSYGAIPPYLPPSYPNQYIQPENSATNQGPMANNYEASMNAYAYNRNAPAFSAAAVASGVPPLPIFQGWNQDTVPLPPYTIPQNGGQYINGYGSNLQTQQYYPPPPAPSLPPPQSSYQQHPLQHKPFEQDLSEGEFEDSNIAGSTSNASYGAAPYQGNDRTGYTDTAQRAVYPRAQEFNTQQSYSGKSANNYNYQSREKARGKRQQSGSYSPYASPSVANNIERSSGTQHKLGTNATAQSQDSNLVVLQQGYGIGQKFAHQSEVKLTSNHSVTLPNAKATILPAVTESTPSVDSQGVVGVHSKSVYESRKIAQGAAFTLFSLGVPLHEFLAEGFREELVKHLLASGGFESSNSSHQVKVSPNFPSQHARQQNITPPFRDGPVVGASKISLKPGQDDRGTLSIATNGNTDAKSTFPQTPIDQLKTSTTSAPAQAPLKTASMIEKDKALKSKMDALRKSREDRAQKAAAKSIVPQIIAATGSGPVADPRPKVTAVEELPSKAEVSAPVTISVSKSTSTPKEDSQESAESLSSITRKQSASKPSHPVAPSQHQLPAIPGLFLASTATVVAQIPTPVVQNVVQSPFLTNQRKRPVAADFDEPITSMAPIKRPFGQSRNEKPLVIDVSEEEIETDDEDVAMELESVADETPAQPMQKQSASTVQLQAVVTNGAQSNSWPPSSLSAASTPPLLQHVARATLGGTKDLQERESEIAKLKKKIAEAVAKKSAEADAKKKKAKHTPSGIQTPLNLEAAAAPEKSGPQDNGAGVKPLASSTKVHQLYNDQENKAAAANASKGAPKLMPISSSPTPQIIQSGQIHLASEQKRLRLEKIANELAADQAAWDQRIAEMARKRAEVAEMEAIHKASEERRQIMLEEKRLLEDSKLVEEDRDSQIVGLVQDKSNHSIIDEETSAVPRSPWAADSVTKSDDSKDKQADLSIQNPSPVVEPELNPEADQPRLSGNRDVEIANQIHEACEGAPNNHQDAEINAVLDEKLSDGISSVPDIEPFTTESKATFSADQALEAALQEAVRIEVDSHAHTEEDTDMDISHTSEPIQLDSGSFSSPAADVPNSPEYSPEPHSHVVLGRESDDYEPPEATPPADYKNSNTAFITMPQSPLDSPPFSPAPPTSGVTSDDISLDFDLAQRHGDVGRNVHNKQVQETNKEKTEAVEIRAEHADQLPPFAIYESPLKLFHAYRFHPQFKQEISGGLKSMTYSHRIDPNKELCRYELAGGICNDSTCDLQHFREIGLPDDAVLTALGSPDEFQGEQRERFCIGLKEVLMKMRLNRVRDFNVIAQEIIAHRQRFLGDISKVLPLEGTNI